MSSTQARLIPSCPKNCLTMFDWLTQTPRFHLQSICSIKSPALFMLQCVGGDGEGAKERGRVTKEAAKQSIWRKHTEVKGQGFLFFLQFCKCTSSCKPAVANIQRSERSPWEMSTRRPGEVVLAYHTGMLVFSSFLGKGNLKALSPAWKRGCQED